MFRTRYPQRDWHRRLGSGVHADVIMDRTAHKTIWIETGRYNLREKIGAECKTDKEIRRCVKRYLARRVFRMLNAGA